MKRLNEKERKRVTVVEETIGSKYYVCTGQTNREPFYDRNCAGILEQSMGARNRGGIGLSYRPARLHITQTGGIVSSETIAKPLKCLKIPSLVSVQGGLVKNVFNSVSDRVYMC